MIQRPNSDLSRSGKTPDIREGNLPVERCEIGMNITFCLRKSMCEHSVLPGKTLRIYKIS